MSSLDINTPVTHSLVQFETVNRLAASETSSVLQQWFLLQDIHTPTILGVCITKPVQLHLTLFGLPGFTEPNIDDLQ